MKRAASILLGVVALAGCQHAAPAPKATPATAPVPVAAKLSQYRLAGDVPQAGLRTLRGGETVTVVLQEVLPQVSHGSQVTVTLIRRGPEGMTRELIDFDAAGHLVNAGQDYVLRDGDELVLPTKPATPVGLERPRIARIGAGS